MTTSTPQTTTLKPFAMTFDFLVGQIGHDLYDTAEEQSAAPLQAKVNQLLELVGQVWVERETMSGGDVSREQVKAALLKLVQAM